MSRLLRHLSGWQARLLEAAVTWLAGSAIVGGILTAASASWTWWALPIAAATGATLEAVKHGSGATTLATLEER